MISRKQQLQDTRLRNGVLELLEGFLVSGCLGDLQRVELHGLGERSALADDGDVTGLNVAEDWRQVARDVLVTRLEAVVLLHVVQVVPEKS